MGVPVDGSAVCKPEFLRNNARAAPRHKGCFDLWALWVSTHRAGPTMPPDTQLLGFHCSLTPVFCLGSLVPKSSAQTSRQVPDSLRVVSA
jgi:hypothetical protein